MSFLCSKPSTSSRLTWERAGVSRVPCARHQPAPLTCSPTPPLCPFHSGLASLRSISQTLDAPHLHSSALADPLFLFQPGGSPSLSSSLCSDAQMSPALQGLLCLPIFSSCLFLFFFLCTDLITTYLLPGYLFTLLHHLPPTNM